MFNEVVQYHAVREMLCERVAETILAKPIFANCEYLDHLATEYEGFGNNIF